MKRTSHCRLLTFTLTGLTIGTQNSVSHVQQTPALDNDHLKNSNGKNDIWGLIGFHYDVIGKSLQKLHYLHDICCHAIAIP